jgi:SAM-dependent methyltransferase
VSSEPSEIVYHHENNIHSLDGAVRALQIFLRDRKITSLLDVGAGNGTWLRAAEQAGIPNVVGVDGVKAQHLFVSPDLIKNADLRKPLEMGRRFDAVLCLEVAEHLPLAAAETLIRSLCIHSNLIYFSAAAPFQCGELHINCQPPEFWQGLFNEQGYVCYDDLRAEMWNETLIEPWYRQNAFTAVHSPDKAGKEPRIRYLVHPHMVEYTDFRNSPVGREYINWRRGVFHPFDYLALLFIAVRWRVQRALGKRRSTQKADVQNSALRSGMSKSSELDRPWV